MMRSLFALLMGLCMSLSQAQAQNVKVVYHITTGVEFASAALGNVRNHLDADPTVKIVVVANGPGIEFMLNDARDSHGREFSGAVQELVNRGVEFRVCNNTLKTRKLDASAVLMEGKIVPSGVAEVARLQSKEGYAYIKP